MIQLATTSTDRGADIRVNGLRMYYESHGVGVPVLLLHGGLETCQMWAPVVAVLSEHYRVITPDSRGHGRTEKSVEPISYALMADDFAQLIRELGLDRPFVAGYSDGGQTALRLAMNYPGLARGYMIGATELRMTEAWRGMMREILGFQEPGQVDFERVAKTNPELIASLQAKHDTFHEPGYWQALLDQASHYWLSPPEYTPSGFAKIIDPTLFWCGDRDTLCPPEQSLEMYRMVKGAELAVIPNADHFTMMQQIEMVIALLQNFIERMNKP